MRWIDLLYRTDQPMGSYVWKAALIALIPSLLIAIPVTLAMPAQTPAFDGPVVLSILGFLVLSPWLETLLMWPILWVLQRFIRGTNGIAVGSATVWALLHSVAAPAWGLVIRPQ
jgi:hypothetical protein